jgi:hypothetical protein
MRGAMEGRSPLLKKTPNNSPEKQKIWKKKFRLSLRNFSFRLAAAPELLESRRTKTIEGQQRMSGKQTRLGSDGKAVEGEGRKTIL